MRNSSSICDPELVRGAPELPHPLAQLARQLGQLLRPEEQQRQHKQNDTVLKTWHIKKSTKGS
jgi:hypothetical protein